MITIEAIENGAYIFRDEHGEMNVVENEHQLLYNLGLALGWDQFYFTTKPGSKNGVTFEFGEVRLDEQL